MLLCDTGPLLAAFNRSDPYHRECAQLLRRNPELVVPAPVLTETALFSMRRYGARGHAKVVEAAARGDFDVMELDAAAHRRVAELCATYDDLPLDQPDASVVAVAERLNLRRVASIDHRHLGRVRPAHCDFLELLP